LQNLAQDIGDLFGGNNFLMNLTPDEFEKAFDDLDKNKNGKIEFHEFIRLFVLVTTTYEENTNHHHMNHVSHGTNNTTTNNNHTTNPQHEHGSTAPDNTNHSTPTNQ